MRIDPKDAPAIAKVIREWIASSGQYLSDLCDDVDHPDRDVDFAAMAERFDVTARATRVLAQLETASQ